MPRRHILFGLVLLLGLPVLAGCGALFGQRYDDFRAYYNTFYNAQRDLERAEREIQRADEPIDRARFVSVFPMRPGTGRTGDQAFENAIRRAADVIREHPNSRWVDNALLLIGKAYFYQGNYDAAAQKFREVLLLEETRTADEARLWLGRSLMEARNFGDAASELRQALDQNGLRPQWAARMHLVLGEAELRRGDLAEARLELRRGLDKLDDSELGARAAFLLGQILDATGDHADAAEAYELSINLRPTPELLYAAGLQYSLALARTGETDAALTRLERKRRDDRYFQQRAEVELVRARALAAAGEPEQARDLIQQVLYYPDAGMRIDRVRGHLHYYLAQIYRDGLDDFPRAAVHFDTAAASLRQSVAALRDVLTTREALLDVQRQAESFGNFAVVHARIAEMDSLLHLGSLDEETFERRIDEIAELRQREMMEAERERRRMADQQDFGGVPVAGGIPGTTTNGNGAPPTTDAGFLSYRNPARVQENLMAFQARWGDRPLVPNWRRRDAMSTAATAGYGRRNGEDGPLTPTTAEVAQAAFVDISAIPRDPESFEAMRYDRATGRYELANVLFLTLGDTERAEYWYHTIIEEDSDLPIVTRARYALAELYAETGREELAADMLADISELPDDDPLGRAARERLGRDVAPLPPDSLQLAEARYATAFEAWQGGAHTEALQSMLDVDKEFSSTPTAARARLAAGMIYMEWASTDTLALIATDPTGLLGDPLTEPEPLLASVWPYAALTFLADSIDVALDETPAELDGPDEPPTIDRPPHPEPDVRPGNDDSPLGIFGQAGEPDRWDHDRLPGQQDDLILHNVDPDFPEPDGTPPGDPDGAFPETEEPPTLSWLEDLFASIEEDFPGTRFAERAARLRAVVAEKRVLHEEHMQQLEAERLAEELLLTEAPPLFGADLLDLGNHGEPDQPGDYGDVPEPDAVPEHVIPDDDFEDTAHEPGAGLPIVPVPTEFEPGDFHETALWGADPIDADAGGFTWAVLTTPRSFEAQNRLVSFHNAGFRTGLVQIGEGQEAIFAVLIGQFESAVEAAAAQDELPDARSADGIHLIELSSELELQTAEDLLNR